MSTRDALRERFAASAGEVVSGEELARELGVSRAAIAKHVAALRTEGFAIIAEPGAGYVADQARSLAPALVERLLGPGAPVLGGGATGSTMDDARALAATAADGTAVIASSQSAGRGRLGRTWASPEGGAYVTVIAHPAFALADAVAAPLAAGLGIAREFERLGARVELKWPNDILVDGRKLAGVLTEVDAEADRVRSLLVGVGTNVFPPEERFDGAAYLAELVEGAALATAAAAVIAGVRSGIAELAEAGFAPMADAYRARVRALGRDVTVSDADGSLIAEGRAVDVDPFGRLLVETAGGVRAIASGDVSLRPPSA